MGREYTLQQIAEKVHGEVVGDTSLIIRNIRPLETAEEGSLSFLSNPRYKSKAKDTRASAIIVSRGVEIEGKSLIRVENPYRAFGIALELFHAEEYAPIGISSEAKIGTHCTLGKRLSIHPFVSIGDDCIIGDGVRIFSGVSIGDGCSISEDTVIHSNVSIYARTRIGSRVIIHSGTVIGSDGYGFATEKGKHYKILQVGGVIIEEDVEIGSNCSIDRGTMGDTIIHKGVKIDNLVQIAHNVIIGENSLIVAQVGISGSTEVGKNAIFAGQAGAAGHLKIGEGAVIAAKSAVFSDVAPKAYVAGYPAVDNMQWKRAQILFGKLPEIRDQLRSLHERMERIEKMMKKEEN